MKRNVVPFGAKRLRAVNEERLIPRPLSVRRSVLRLRSRRRKHWGIYGVLLLCFAAAIFGMIWNGQ